jgi:hypothetical protein
MLTVAVTASCQFITVGEAGVGLFSAEFFNSGCIKYGTGKGLDPALKAGRTFAVFGCLFMSAALVLVCLIQFLLYKGRDQLWTALHVCLYCSTWFALLTFFPFGSMYCDSQYFECKLGAVAGLNILNVFLFIALDILLFYVKAGPTPVLTIFQPTTETNQENAGGNGTVSTTKEGHKAANEEEEDNQDTSKTHDDDLHHHPDNIDLDDIEAPPEVIRESDENEEEESTDSDESNKLKEGCTEKRVDIREVSEKCIICLYQKRQGTTEHCKLVKKGCPGCNVVLCKDHWNTTFDHNPSKWIKALQPQ